MNVAASLPPGGAGALPRGALPELALAALAAVHRPAQAFSDLALPSAVEALRAEPEPGDRALVRLADALALTDAELMAAALVLAAETDAEAARAVAEAQAPLGGSRPLIGLAAACFRALGASPDGLAAGRAAAAGLLTPGPEPAALPERSLAIPLAVVSALRGGALAPEGVRRLRPGALPMPVPVLEAAQARGRALAEAPAGPGDAVGPGLVIRAGARAEGLRLAALAAAAAGLELAEVPAEGAPPAGLGPWLLASGLAPVFAPALAAGDRWSPPDLPGWRGPWFALAGAEGLVEAEPAPADWTPPAPDAEARARLWRAGGLSPEDAARAAQGFRQGPARIAEVAAFARAGALARGAEAPGWEDLRQAAARGAEGLAPAARLVPGAPADEALVLPAALREAMAALVARARVRDRLHLGLGPAAAARPRTGLAALFSGESGTGKTLAASWFAARLGLPLYRADLAALTSKWIGETEKNLDGLFSAAARADAVLFFDEADALFAARTDVGDAHDRHANAQTNYLLQRIESFEGVAILASNNRERFDPAFTRRLDAILDFPMPEAPARAALWRAHLGEACAVPSAEIDALAIGADLAGGHIRNAVFAAAARAAAQGRGIEAADLWAGIAEEYAKLGRPAPARLSPRLARPARGEG
ncbi:AAA family ATPase [Albimonas sp. CAU 1670]|uniref:ATP-binding protein n=1 Tax=Albimonas sp. CAU 1670 TaxID=3032599 RepID=UPI0023DAA14E|nr:AAA family ATPase [Albimonas sp. CAU 1670]MDF2235412.1 AAA family ATPase [Albimonas sp. CAU 1670]